MLTSAFKKVFRDWKYGLFAVAISFGFFAFAVWLPNFRLIFSIALDPLVPIADKFLLPINLLGSITTNFSVLSASYTIATAILLGIDVAMIVYFLKRRVADMTHSGLAAGFIGISSGLLGTGCAACGSFILMSALTVAGGASLVTLLPLHGAEFGILGVVLLSISVYLTAKQIQNPLVCKG